MEEIDIQTHGIELDEFMIKSILKRIHSVFGFSKYEIHKMVITLSDVKDNEGNEWKGCFIQIKAKDYLTITTELKSLDIYTAITLAIESAHLKLEHRTINDKTLNNKLEHHRKINLYGSHNMYQ